MCQKDKYYVNDPKSFKLILIFWVFCLELHLHNFKDWNITMK